ncbi:MAG: hypothetical protein LUG12_04300 [Erysipelotrichaceae bacterium]|nr:hypothetical protein [Erysipelotrichaceae bacterium]
MDNKQLYDLFGIETTNELLKNLQNENNYYNKRKKYEEETSIEQYCLDLKKRGIDFSEEAVLSLYEMVQDVQTLWDYFYQKDERKWMNIDDQPHLSFNSDSLFTYIKRIVEKHYNIFDSMDIYYITQNMLDLENCPKKEFQQTFTHHLIILTNYANIHDIHKLSILIPDYDMNEIIKDYIKRCHNRNYQFKEMMKRFYATFHDADTSIYKV